MATEEEAARVCSGWRGPPGRREPEEPPDDGGAASPHANRGRGVLAALAAATASEAATASKAVQAAPDPGPRKRRPRGTINRAAGVASL